MRLELNGTSGSLAFDFEDMNALWLYDAADGPDAGFRKILVTEPEHPYTGNWWPTGHPLGYEHLFTHQAVDLIHAINAGQPPARLADALQVQKVLAAIETSAHNTPCDTVLHRRPPGPKSPRRHRNQRPQQQPLAHPLSWSMRVCPTPACAGGWWDWSWTSRTGT